MNEYVKKMVNDAINRIDSLSVEELEKEFRSFGLDVERKRVPHVVTYSSDNGLFTIVSSTAKRVNDLRFINHFSRTGIHFDNLDVVKNTFNFRQFKKNSSHGNRVAA
ncbi:MAG: hypothetical protein WBI40_11950 [Methylococcaceae bacterium]